MTVLGWIIVVVASLIVGVVAQFLLKAESMPYRWALTAIATFIGAAVASELLFNGTTPELEGMALWPAIVGGLVVGIVVDLVVVYISRQSTGGGAAVR